MCKKEFCLEIWGDFACFTRPEMKAERVSYEVITPSAARAIFEAIFCKPYAMRWQVTKIEVLNPIKWSVIRRNEVDVVTKTPIYIEDHRQQRNALLLKDVRYRIYAFLEFIPVGERNTNACLKHEPGGDEKPEKYFAMFERRASKGQCFKQPYLGCREFSANWKYISTQEDRHQQPIEESKDLGLMLYDMDFDKDPNTPDAMFYKAVMKNGVIEVPNKSSEEVKRLYKEEKR